MGYEELEKSSLMPQKNFEERFGQSPVFQTEAIHVISCGYEEKTEWGKEVRTIIIFTPKL